jgi:hypothetical protein
VTANYKDGILTISVPKLTNTARKPTRVIPIESGDKAIEREESTIPTEFVVTDSEPSEERE